MRHPQNYRAYGVLLRGGRVLIAAERVGPVFAWKYPGGGVEAGETAEEAVAREFREETGMNVRTTAELLDPGTKISPWTGGPYTPVYFLVESPDRPVAPAGEAIGLSFKDPDAALASPRMAAPEKEALRIALGRVGRGAPRRSRRPLPVAGPSGTDAP